MGYLDNSKKIVNAAGEVGITKTGSSVDLMQQDKFERAAACIDVSSDSSIFSPFLSLTPSSAIVSPNKKRGYARYWENKFHQAVNIISVISGTSINLQWILGLMSVQIVKPKLTKTKNRVTQVHGSMKSQKVLELLKDIDKKEEESESTYLKFVA